VHIKRCIALAVSLDAKSKRRVDGTCKIHCTWAHCLRPTTCRGELPAM